MTIVTPSISQITNMKLAIVASKIIS